MVNDRMTSSVSPFPDSLANKQAQQARLYKHMEMLLASDELKLNDVVP